MIASLTNLIFQTVFRKNYKQIVPIKEPGYVNGYCRLVLLLIIMP